MSGGSTSGVEGLWVRVDEQECRSVNSTCGMVW